MLRRRDTVPARARQLGLYYSIRLLLYAPAPGHAGAGLLTMTQMITRAAPHRHFFISRDFAIELIKALMVLLGPGAYWFHQLAGRATGGGSVLPEDCRCKDDATARTTYRSR